MKKAIYLLVFNLFLGFGLAQAQQTPPAAKQPARIIGVAKDLKTGEAVSYATAALYKSGTDTNIAGGVADDEGKFFIAGFELGSYDLEDHFPWL